MRYTIHAPRVQHADGTRHVREIFEHAGLFRTTVERVELMRKRDPHARYLQVVALSSRRVIDAFWRAPIRLNLRGVVHESGAEVLMLAGMGTWFRPVLTDDVLAGCIVCGDDITRAPANERSLLDLSPLNAVGDWIQRERWQ